MQLKLPRIRLSLRAFLIVTTIMGSGSGLFVRQKMREQAAEEKLVNNGLVILGGAYDAYNISSFDEERQEAFATYVGRLRWFLFHYVKVVMPKEPWSGERGKLLDKLLAPLRELRRVESVILQRQPITNEALADLSQLKSIKNLTLELTKINDEGLHHLARLSNLERLNLGQCVETQQPDSPQFEFMK